MFLGNPFSFLPLLFTFCKVDQTFFKNKTQYYHANPNYKNSYFNYEYTNVTTLYNDNFNQSGNNLVMVIKLT